MIRFSCMGGDSVKKYVNGKYIDMTAEEIAIMQADQAQAEATERHRPLTESEALTLLLKQQVNTLEVDDQTAFRMREFYPAWAAGVSCAVGYKAQDNGRLWRCLQAHTSQDGWTPTAAHSLWAKVLIPDPGTIPEWEQPESTNPYMAGDKVTHNGKTWVSDIDNNVWEPGAYGWSEYNG